MSKRKSSPAWDVRNGDVVNYGCRNMLLRSDCDGFSFADETNSFGPNAITCRSKLNRIKHGNLTPQDTQSLRVSQIRELRARIAEPIGLYAHAVLVTAQKQRGHPRFCPEISGIHDVPVLSFD
jgi:hypothetical protein